MYCIDASVFVSAFSGYEPYSERSKAFLSKIAQNQEKVFLPETITIEVAWGLSRATKRIDSPVGFVHAMRTVSNFTFVVIDERLAERAIEVILAAGLRSGDSIYTALALEYGLTLITLDQNQLRRSRKLIRAKEP